MYIHIIRTLAARMVRLSFLSFSAILGALQFFTLYLSKMYFLCFPIKIQNIIQTLEKFENLYVNAGFAKIQRSRHVKFEVS